MHMLGITPNTYDPESFHEFWTLTCFAVILSGWKVGMRVPTLAEL